jgi:hypothetical protein
MKVVGRVALEQVCLSALRSIPVNLDSIHVLCSSIIYPEQCNDPSSQRVIEICFQHFTPDPAFLVTLDEKRKYKALNFSYSYSPWAMIRCYISKQV